MDRLPLKERFDQTGIGEAAGKTLPLAEGNIDALFHTMSLMTGTQHYELEAQRALREILAWRARLEPEDLGDLVYQSSPPYKALNRCYGGLLYDAGVVLNSGYLRGHFTAAKACDIVRRILVAPLLAAEEIRQADPDPRAAIQQAWEAYQEEYRKEED